MSEETNLNKGRGAFIQRIERKQNGDIKYSSASPKKPGTVVYDSMYDPKYSAQAKAANGGQLQKGYKEGTLDSDPAGVGSSYSGAAPGKYGNAIEPYPRQTINKTLINRFAGSSYLGPILDCIVVNVSSFGYSIRERDKKIKDVPGKEKARLDNFFRYVNPRQNITGLIEQLVIDFVTTGYCCAEIIRKPYNLKAKDWQNPARTPSINSIFHRPSYTFEKCRLMPKAVHTYGRRVYMKDGADGYEVKRFIDTDRFRLWKQTYLDGSSIYFKEYGDPRFFHRETGEELRGSAITQAAKADKLATEIYVIEDKVYYGMYSVPRHFGLVDYDLRGDRTAAEVNYRTTRTNGIPNLLIVGKIDKDSVDAVQKFTDELNSPGTWNSSTLIIRPEDPLSPDEKVDVKIEKLKDTKSDDSMFNNYRKNVHKLTRESFRLPALVLGQETATTKEQMRSAIAFAEEQIFSSIRNKFHDFLNDHILPELKIANAVIQINTPNITDSQSLVNTVRDLEKTGGVTPRIGRTILEAATGFTFEEIPKDVKPDHPWSGTMAEKAKKEASGGDPTEPSQTITSERFTGNKEDNREQRVEK